MHYRQIPLGSLIINRANDRHGELENETSAIAWLFNNREQHMKSLAKDIVQVGRILEPPLVSPDGEKYIVFDGNRRVTCLKVIAEPHKAPNADLQQFFADLKAKWAGGPPDLVQCQVEADRDRIDDILFRRHTGSQGGVGQSTWDDRMKANFVNRSGKGAPLNAADEIERRLANANLIPNRKKIPRSTLNRLLSSEGFRNRVGFSLSRGRFELTHQEHSVLKAFQRIADDLANKRIVLGDIWDVDGKRAYLDRLEREGVLPSISDRIPSKPLARPKSTPPAVLSSTSAIVAPRPHKRQSLIPHLDYGLTWSGRLQRHRAIWEELQFKLNLAEHPNAISVLFRVLLELSTENYISQTPLDVGQNDKIALKVVKVAEHLHSSGKIDDKYLREIRKLQGVERLISVDTLNRYVHSPDLAPSPEHLSAVWDTLAKYVRLCLDA